MQKFFLSVMVLLSMFVTMPALAVAADPTDAATKHACGGVTGQFGGGCSKKEDAFLEDVLETVLNILSFIAGVAAVIMIIISGLKYTTSGGEASKISSAKSSLIYAIVGLLVVAFAQFIVRFVLDSVK